MDRDESMKKQHEKNYGASTREALAKLMHNQWTGWMKYLFSKCSKHWTGGILIPRPLVERWQRQMETPYSDLPEEEKESDRLEADKILELFKKRQ